MCMHATNLSLNSNMRSGDCCVAVPGRLPNVTDGLFHRLGDRSIVIYWAVGVATVALPVVVHETSQ